MCLYVTSSSRALSVNNLHSLSLQEGQSALHLAVMRNRIVELLMLIESGANPDTADKASWRTVLITIIVSIKLWKRRFSFGAIKLGTAAPFNCLEDSAFNPLHRVHSTHLSVRQSTLRSGRC
jgi:ankyrin repeat protein